MKITLIDMLTALLFLLYIGNAIVIGEVNLFFLSACLFLLTCYFVVKNKYCKQWLPFAISMAGLGEALLALLQEYSVVSSNHQLFKMTGTFGNPGPLAGLLAVSFVVTIGIAAAFHSKRRSIFGCAIAVALVQLVALLLSDSRAGWVATLGGLTFLFYPKIPLSRQAKRILLLACFLSLLVGAYFYRPASADGRMLIWRVTTNMIADKPLIGHGVGAFEKEYMYYQADFFKEHPSSPFMMQAGETVYSYNELLRVWVELGIVGVLLCVWIFFVAVRRPANRKGSIFQAGLWVWGVFSLFSYPSSVFVLLLLGTLLLGATESRVVFAWQMPRMLKRITTICIVGIATTYAAYGYAQLLYLQHNMDNLGSDDEAIHAQSEQYLEKHYSFLKCHPLLLDRYVQYAYACYDTDKSLPILTDAATIIPNSGLLCDLGDVHQHQGNITQAVDCYQQSSYMIPYKLTPKYNLFQIYRMQGDTLQMIRVGTDILATPVKIEGTKTLRIKAMVSDVLNTLCK